MSHLEAGDSGVTVIVLLEKSVGIAGCFQIPPFVKESLQGTRLGSHLPSFIPVSKSPRTQVLGTPRVSSRTGRTCCQQPRNALNISPRGPRLQKDAAVDSSSLSPLAFSLGQAHHKSWLSQSVALTLLLSVVKDVSVVHACLCAAYLPFQLDLLWTGWLWCLVLCAVEMPYNREVILRCINCENLLAEDKLSCLSEKQK